MINFYKHKLKGCYYLITTALLLFCLVNITYAQGEMQDVVYLKNGSVIRGMIVEQVPNESLKIRTADGSLFVYEFSQIEKIAKEAPVNETATRTKKTRSAAITTDKNVKLSPYFSIGVTAAAPTLEELDFYYPDLYERDLNPLAIGGGIQALFAVKSVWLGFDFGVRKTFKSTTNYDQSLIYSTGYSQQIDKETAYNFIFLTEYGISRYLFLQGGLGAYMSSWFYSYEYTNPDHNSSYVYSEYNGTHWNFGLMLAGGTEFPITENIYIPLYLRFDLMFRYGIMVPITINTGIRVAL